jgi:hypothetical protein
MQPEPVVEGHRRGRDEKKTPHQGGGQGTGKGCQGNLPPEEEADGRQGEPEDSALDPECGDPLAPPAGIGVRRFVNNETGQQADEMDYQPERDLSQIQVAQNEAQETASSRDQKDSSQGQPAGSSYRPQHVPKGEIPDCDLRQG